MPFTLAHPAAIIPLQRLRFLALLPLIVGSIVPDILSFAPYRFRWRFPDSHTLPGLIPVDVPLGYGILIVIVVLRRQLIAPLWGANRTLVQVTFDHFLAQRNCWLYAALSLLVGSFTHLLWDNFTHADRWMVRSLPVLQHSLFPASDHPLQLFHALQYISSAVGLFIIGWCYWRALQRLGSNTQTTQKAKSPASYRRYLLLVLVGLSLAGGITFASHVPRQFISTYTFLAISSRVAMANFALLYLCAGFIIHLNDWRQKNT